MGMLLLLACVHTPPHDPVQGQPSVTAAWREEPLDPGACMWSSENLRFGGTPLWVEDTPPEDGWCRAPSDSARLVDVLGVDGPFLSARLETRSCCPERVAVRCVTWDVRTGAPATLESYDPRHAERRWERAQRRAPDGYALEREGFLVGDRHVRFCARRGEDVVLVGVP
jgi:hypothetical protein